MTNNCILTVQGDPNPAAVKAADQVFDAIGASPLDCWNDFETKRNLGQPIDGLAEIWEIAADAAHRKDGAVLRCHRVPV